MPIINFQVNTGTSDAAIAAFNNAVRSTGTAVDELTKSSFRLNDAGLIAKGSIDQMTASGQRLTTTFKESAGQLVITSTSIKSLGAAAQEAGQKGAKGGAAFGVSWQGLLRIAEVQLFRRGITGLINAFQQGVQSAIQYQVALQQAGNVTNQVGSNFDDFSGRVRSMSEQFGINIFQGLGAAQTALTGQLGNSSQGFEVLNQAMRLSVATGTDVATATNLMTSALQAFHLEGDQASRVANTLYVVAQRSRTPLGETQTAISRVSQTAHALGLSFEEISALFLTISQQGGRPTEAFSLLNQVMARLISPTKELQALYDRWGTPTAALALQTFGLTGTFQKLNEEAIRAPHNLGDIVGPLRSLRGLMALTGDSTRAFEENLRNIGQSAGQLGQGVQRVQDTPAHQLQVEFEKVRNIFTQDIGQSFIKNVVEISQALGGAQASVSGLFQALKVLAASYAAYKIILGVLPAMINSMTAAQTANTAATQAGAGSFNALGIAFTAAYIAGNLLFTTLDQIERARIGQFAAAGAASARESQQAAEAVRARHQQELTEDKRIVQESFRGRLQAAAEAVRLADAVRDRELQRHREIAESYRVNSQAYLDTLRDRLSQTRETANREKNFQLQSLREVQSFRQQVEQQGFQRQLGIEQDPNAAADLIRNRIQQRQRQAQGIFTDPQSSLEDIQRARQMFQEISTLQNELGGREKEIALERQANLGEGVVVERMVNGEMRRYLDLSNLIARARERDIALVQERDRLEAVARGNIAAREAETRRELALQQTRLRIFDMLLNQQQQFKVFERPGQLVERFQIQEERQRGSGLTAAQDELARLSERLRQSVREQFPDMAEQVPQMRIINQLIEERERALNEEFRVNQASLDTRRQQVTVNEQLAASTYDIVQLNRRAAEQQAEAARIAGNIGTILSQRLQAGSQLGDLSTFGEIGAGGNRNVIERTRVQYNAYVEAVDAARIAQEAFQRAGGQTAQNLTRLDDALGRVRTRGEQLSASLAPGNVLTLTPGSAQFLGLQGINDFGDTFKEQLRTALDSIGGLRGAQEAVSGSMRGLINSETARQIQQWREQQAPGAAALQNLQAIPNAAQPAGAAIEQAFRGANVEAGNLNRTMAQIEAQLQALGVGVPAPVIPAPGDMFGGVAGRRATGGVIGAFPGRPRGTDVLPYWLTPGEFIMPAAQTSQFFTQLLSMRMGQQPKYAAAGGVVVGDINITMQGSGPAEKTVREIGRGLDREIRRGTIRLGRKG